MNLPSFLKRLGDDTQGATAVEYGLILGLIVLAMLGALKGVATTNDRMWTDVETKTVTAINN